MRNDEFQTWLAQADRLTAEQRGRALTAINQGHEAAASLAVIELRVDQHRRCPRGHARGLRRLRGLRSDHQRLDRYTAVPLVPQAGLAPLRRGLGASRIRAALDAALWNRSRHGLSLLPPLSAARGSIGLAVGGLGGIRRDLSAAPSQGKTPARVPPATAWRQVPQARSVGLAGAGVDGGRARWCDHQRRGAGHDHSRTGECVAVGAGLRRRALPSRAAPGRRACSMRASINWPGGECGAATTSRRSTTATVNSSCSCCRFAVSRPSIWKATCTDSIRSTAPASPRRGLVW